MSFLGTYVEKHRLDKMSDSIKNNINNLEDSLTKAIDKVKSGASFIDVAKTHASDIADLIERASKHFDNWNFTLGNSFASFRFVINISTEVYQIVENMSDSIISDDMSEEEKEATKTEFSVDLVWYVWSVIGLLNDKFRWIPFKKSIERKIVRWLARMGVDAARDLFKANEKKVMSLVMENATKRIIIKSLSTTPGLKSRGL